MTKRHHVLSPNADLQTRLGAIVRACRHQLGITQEELAWRAGLHRTYIADIERGKRNVTLRSVAHLAKSLQVTLGHLFAHISAPSHADLRAGAEPAPNEVHQILLVEHSTAAAALTASVFKRAKLANPLSVVRDGEAALHYLFGTGPYANRKSQRPQLILFAANGSGMSGPDFLQRVKGDARSCHIPVVILRTATSRKSGPLRRRAARH